MEWKRSSARLHATLRKKERLEVELIRKPTGLRRLAGDCDELQVGSEFALEARVAAPADRPSRILGGDLLAAARAALLKLLQIRIYLHDWNGRRRRGRCVRRKG